MLHWGAAPAHGRPSIYSMRIFTQQLTLQLRAIFRLSYRLLPADQRHCCAVCAGASDWITDVEHGSGDAMWDVHCLGGDAPSQVRAWQWVAHSGVRSFSQAAQVGWAAVRISTEDTLMPS